MKDIQHNLVSAGEYPTAPSITGLSDPKRFNSSLSTYIDYQKIMPTALLDLTKRADIEKIILWSTIFEDTGIFITKLARITWLTADQRKQLSHIRYRGWGQLSKKLLTGFEDDNGRTIIEGLWETNHNFMELRSQAEVASQITAANKQDLDDADLKDAINDLYTSPQNKKAIREVMLVLADIKRAMHGQAPSWVFIEAARGGGQKGRRTQSRASQIQAVYQDSAKEIVDSQVQQELKTKIKDKAEFNDRLVLYFMQNGRDIYTGKSINIDRLSEYDIDHILPQALIKDDSLDNRVLTDATGNREKNDSFAMERFGDKMAWQWREWHKMGLISSRKLRHLTMRSTDIDKYAVGFVNRQLVETRQIIKLVTSLIDTTYPETTIVSVKANLTHQFRVAFDFPKLREVNNYHHAFDAYLTAFLGTYLLKRYPKLERFFVYGKFAKLPINMKHFNIIRSLEKAQEPIVVPETGEVIWNKTSDLAMFEKIYNFKRILVNREIFENRGAMFNQTLYKASDNNSKKLIPKKDGFDTAIYGGYSGGTPAYLAIVKVTKKNSVEYRIIGVPTLMIVKINRLKSRGFSEKHALTELLESKFQKVNKRTGNVQTSDYEVVLPHVKFEQVIRDDVKGATHRFSLGTSTDYHNIQELILPLKFQRKLNKNTKSAADLDDVFDRIINQVQDYFQLFENRSFREKLLSSNTKFKKLVNISDKFSVLNEICKTLHANASNGDLSLLGLGTGFGRTMLSGGIKLSADAEIIYQSPTGLFERKVALKDL